MPEMTPLAGSTILVVDDEPILNMTMSLLLRRQGATVLTAADGVEALRLFDDWRQIHAMVCDQNMPNMDGRTLLTHLQARGRTVPTLFFVSGVEREDTEALEAMNVRLLVTKPIQPLNLIAAVESLLTA